MTIASRPKARFTREKTTPLASFSVRAWSYTDLGCEESCEGTMEIVYRGFTAEESSAVSAESKDSCSDSRRAESWRARYERPEHG